MSAAPETASLYLAALNRLRRRELSLRTRLAVSPREALQALREVRMVLERAPAGTIMLLTEPEGSSYDDEALS